MRRADDPEVAAWLSKAGEDMRAAGILLAQDPRLEGVICFLCQQAAEKFLKALLVATDRVPPRTHDLDVLVADLSRDFPEIESNRDSATFLKGFAVMPRYPSFMETGSPSENQSGAAVSHARLIERAVLSLLDGKPTS